MSEMKMMLEKLMMSPTTTVPVAGTLLGLSRNKAYAAAARGEIPYIAVWKAHRRAHDALTTNARA
jgi:hypothetical protein